MDVPAQQFSGFKECSWVFICRHMRVERKEITIGRREGKNCLSSRDFLYFRIWAFTLLRDFPKMDVRLKDESEQGGPWIWILDHREWFNIDKKCKQQLKIKKWFFLIQVHNYTLIKYKLKHINISNNISTPWVRRPF